MEFDAMLDASGSDFANQLAKALGLKEGDKLRIVTPQFARVDGRAVTYFPRTIEEYAALPRLSGDALRKIGCQIWEVADGQVLWLYPAEWYNHIPDGLQIVDIFGDREEFKRGETDNDCRFGALSFGFLADAA